MTCQGRLEGSQLNQEDTALRRASHPHVSIFHDIEETWHSKPEFNYTKKNLHLFSMPVDLKSRRRLLSTEDRHVPCSKCLEGSRKQRWWSRPLAWKLMASTHIFISIFLVAAILKTLSLIQEMSPPTQSCHTFLSPTDDQLFDGALSFSTSQPGADAWKNGIFCGASSRNSNAAWDRLQQVRGVAVASEEASRVNLPVTGLSAGNGTIATLLGVQHNLHCIRFVRQVLHPSYYYPNQTVTEREERITHAGHCLEALRQSVMCTPDLTPRSVLWEDDEKSNIAVNPSVKLECLDWSTLVDWMRGRMYNLNDLWEANP